MKHLICSAIVITITGIINPAIARAQNNSLQNRALIENVNRLQGQLEDLLQSYNSLKKEVDILQIELRKTRAESLKSKPDSITKSDIEGLTKAIREVDRKRSADKELILKEIRNIARNSNNNNSRPITTTPSTTNRKPQKGFEHTVQSGETISAIIAAYNEQLKIEGSKKRIALNSVLKANPKLNPRSIQIGQILFIPDPR
tara:strand:+ start:851 stop:1453 length:603 start_codon:yes stop_codon:yes gene_type:complete